MSQRTLFTVGHSTRPWGEFVDLLKAWKIDVLVDVRTVPKSRTFPWFSLTKMELELPKAGIRYVHLPSLGGLRRAERHSVNTAWRNSSFRGYADYMQREDFQDGLKTLNSLRRKSRVCVMCSEAVWWRCHRRMIADAEVARGVPVKHLMTKAAVKQHELSDFAVITKRRGQPPKITYPEIDSET
jgi:uncharacterized protein (DUF488 family)